MSGISNIQKQITINQRRLQLLKEQQATFGLHTPPYISLDIENTEKAIAELEETLAELRSDGEELDGPRAAETQKQRAQIYLQGEFSTLTPETKSAAIAAFAAVMGISPQAVELYSVTPGSIVFQLGLPRAGVQRLRARLRANSAQLRLLKVERVRLEWSQGDFEEWVFREGKFNLVNTPPPPPPSKEPPLTDTTPNSQGMSLYKLLLIGGFTAIILVVIATTIGLWTLFQSSPPVPSPVATEPPPQTRTPTRVFSPTPSPSPTTQPAVTPEPSTETPTSCATLDLTGYWVRDSREVRIIQTGCQVEAFYLEDRVCDHRDGRGTTSTWDDDFEGTLAVSRVDDSGSARIVGTLSVCDYGCTGENCPLSSNGRGSGTFEAEVSADHQTINLSWEASFLGVNEHGEDVYRRLECVPKSVTQPVLEDELPRCQ